MLDDVSLCLCLSMVSIVGAQPRVSAINVIRRRFSLCAHPFPFEDWIYGIGVASSFGSCDSVSTIFSPSLLLLYCITYPRSRSRAQLTNVNRAETDYILFALTRYPDGRCGERFSSSAIFFSFDFLRHRRTGTGPIQTDDERVITHSRLRSLQTMGNRTVRVGNGKVPIRYSSLSRSPSAPNAIYILVHIIFYLITWHFRLLHKQKSLLVCSTKLFLWAFCCCLAVIHLTWMILCNGRWQFYSLT